MKTLWSGKLVRFGRAKKPFDAEIIKIDEKVIIIERDGINVTEVSPEEITGEAWMRALVAILEKD